MLVHGARVAKTLRGRLERGEDVLECVELLAADHDARAAELHAVGTLEDVTIVTMDPARRTFGQEQVLKGAVEVLALWATLRGGAGPGGSGGVVRAHALLARGSEVIEGTVLAARALSLEFEMQCWSGAAWAMPGTETPLRVAQPERTVSSIAAPAATANEVKPHPEPVKTLAEAARALEAQPALKAERPAEYEPEEGDILDHPTFGLIQVVGEAESGNSLIKVMQTGSRREISLSVFDVIPREPRDGKRAFLLRARRR